MELRMEERPIGVADDRMIERVLLHCLNSQMARDADSPLGGIRYMFCSIP